MKNYTKSDITKSKVSAYFYLFIFSVSVILGFFMPVSILPLQIMLALTFILKLVATSIKENAMGLKFSHEDEMELDKDENLEEESYIDEESEEALFSFDNKDTQTPML